MVQGSSGPSLDFGTGPIRASDACASPLLGVTIMTSVMRSMFLAYVRHASIGSVRFVVFDDPSTPSPQRHFVHAFIASRVDYVTPC